MFSASTLFGHLGDQGSQAAGAAPPLPENYVTEDGATFYVAEDGVTFYVTET